MYPVAKRDFLFHWDVPRIPTPLLSAVFYPPTRHKQQHHSNSHGSLDGRQSVNTWLRHSNCPHIIVTLIDKFSELTHCHFIHIHIESVQFHCMHWQGTFHIVMLILHLEGASRDQSHLGAVFLLSYSLPRCCLYPVIC